MAGPLRRRDDMLLAGVWELQSGSVRHPDVLLAAARHALGRFDLELAERLARAARGAAPDWDADWLLAQILRERARPREALAALPAEPPPGCHRLAMWAVTRACVLYWGQGRTDEAERTLLRVPHDAPGWDLAEATRSWVLFYDGRCRAALDAAEAVLALPEPDDQAVVWAAMGGAAAAGALGRPDRAAAIVERGRAVAKDRADGLSWSDAQVGYGQCHALALTGALAQARDVAEDGYRAALAGEAGGMAGLWAAYRGFVAKAQGRLADARAALREAVALLEAHDEYRIVRVCLAELAGVAALAGDADGAAECLQRADARRGGANRIFDAWIELDRAWTQAASGAVTRAAETAQRAADLARQTDQPTFEAAALYDAARLGAAPAVRDRLAALARDLSGAVAAAMARAAAALAAGDPSSLEEAARAFTEHGHLLHAGEVWAAAARRYKGQRQAVRSRVALERATALVARCQGAQTPLLLDLSGVGPLLTPREREIAMLAVGMRSRDIADRLGLSVHTVNNALARVFAKVGVTSRRDLGAMLGQRWDG
jgi:DNA-binding CsgD family transcriptional regulator